MESKPVSAKEGYILLDEKRFFGRLFTSHLEVFKNSDEDQVATETISYSADMVKRISGESDFETRAWYFFFFFFFSISLL